MKIESGAKSVLDPNAVHSIRPYLEEDAPGLDLEVPGVTIVDAERTFWDKVVILHGLHRWYELKGVHKGGGNRISRHYYDLHELMQSPTGQPAFDLASAVPPTFTLMPEGDIWRIEAGLYGDVGDNLRTGA